MATVKQTPMSEIAAILVAKLQYMQYTASVKEACEWKSVIEILFPGEEPFFIPVNKSSRDF
jgi:hypothetical protein